MHFAQLKTNGGYVNSEVTSAMQKSIRRGLEEEALFWATELELAGYGGYVWKRLRIIASEDIGMADPNVCVQVRTLYENWLEQKKNKEDRSLAERLFLVHAILIVVRAKKSRMVDTALITLYEGDREKRKIPDVALDVHTIRGRKMGRGVDHFFTEGATCANGALLFLQTMLAKMQRHSRAAYPLGSESSLAFAPPSHSRPCLPKSHQTEGYST